jgi:hypothetical protein
MVGHASREREAVLRHVEAVHFAVGVAALGKSVSGTKSPFAGIQEIAADGKDHVSLSEIDEGTGTCAEQGFEV